MIDGEVVASTAAASRASPVCSAAAATRGDLPLRVRPAAPGGRGSSAGFRYENARPAAQGLASGARCATHRIETAGRAALRGRLPQGPGGHHRQAGRQPLPRHPVARLAQAEMPCRAGAGDRRLHRAARIAHGLRRAARGLLRGERLRYAGKVGTGFDRATLAELARSCASASATDSRRSPTSSRSRAGRTGSSRSWSRRSAFGEWTRDGRLRHPRYLGLRDDKPAGDVVRERPA